MLGRNFAVNKSCYADKSLLGNLRRPSEKDIRKHVCRWLMIFSGGSWGLLDEIASENFLFGFFLVRMLWAWEGPGEVETGMGGRAEFFNCST